MRFQTNQGHATYDVSINDDTCIVDGGKNMVVKFGLFLSAYSPLFLILGLQAMEFSSNEQADYHGVVAFGILFLAGVLSFVFVVCHARKRPQQTLTISGTHLSGGNAVGYLSGYLLPFVGSSISFQKDWPAYLVFFLIAGIVTVQTDVIQINPLFFVFGYRIYATEATFTGVNRKVTNTINIVLITKRKLATGKTIRTYQLNDEVRLTD